MEDFALIIGFMFYMTKLTAMVAIPAVLFTLFYEKYIEGSRKDYKLRSRG
jgi:hypothetical protein